MEYSQGRIWLNCWGQIPFIAGVYGLVVNFLRGGGSFFFVEVWGNYVGERMSLADFFLGCVWRGRGKGGGGGVKFCGTWGGGGGKEDPREGGVGG